MNKFHLSLSHGCLCSLVTTDDRAPDAGDASFMTKVLRENLISVKADVEVQQKDPNSPLYSVKTFEELNL